HYLVYSSAGERIRLDLTGVRGTYTASWLDPRTGGPVERSTSVEGGKMGGFPGPGAAPRVLWLTRQKAAGGEEPTVSGLIALPGEGCRSHTSIGISYRSDNQKVFPLSHGPAYNGGNARAAGLALDPDRRRAE